MTSQKFSSAAEELGRTKALSVNQPSVDLPRDLERALDEALVEGFPASDPVAIDVEKMPESLGPAKAGIGMRRGQRRK